MSNTFTDLAGLGRLIAEFRLTLMELLLLSDKKRTLALKNTEQALKNQQLALKNEELSIKNRSAELQLAEKLLTISNKNARSLSQPSELIAFLSRLYTSLSVPQLNSIVAFNRKKNRSNRSSRSSAIAGEVLEDDDPPPA